MVRKKRSEMKHKEELSADLDVDAMFSVDVLEAVDSQQDLKLSINRDSSGLPPPAAHIFESAQGAGRSEFPKLPDMRSGFEELVSDIFDNIGDVFLEYTEIRESLSVNGALTPNAVNEAANNAEKMADRAYKLYCIGRLEYEAYVREIDTIEAAMRDGAVAELEKQKANRSRTKQITDADVRAEIAQRYPDEWNNLQTRRTKASAMSDYLENLSKLAMKRCFSIGKMQRD